MSHRFEFTKRRKEARVFNRYITALNALMATLDKVPGEPHSFSIYKSEGGWVVYTFGGGQYWLKEASE